MRLIVDENRSDHSRPSNRAETAEADLEPGNVSLRLASGNYIGINGIHESGSACPQTFAATFRQVILFERRDHQQSPK